MCNSYINYKLITNNNKLNIIRKLGLNLYHAWESSGKCGSSKMTII